MSVCKKLRSSETGPLIRSRYAARNRPSCRREGAAGAAPLNEKRRAQKRRVSHHSGGLESRAVSRSHWSQPRFGYYSHSSGPGCVVTTSGSFSEPLAKCSRSGACLYERVRHLHSRPCSPCGSLYTRWVRRCLSLVARLRCPGGGACDCVNLWHHLCRHRARILLSRGVRVAVFSLLL